MTPENLLRDETRLWLRHVRADLRAAGAVLREDLPEQSLFHSQQAAEKALKAFPTWHGRQFPKTHDLSELGPLCSTIDASLTSIATQAETLSKYAVQFRYPGAPYKPGLAEAEEALRLATCVFDEVRRRLPPLLDEPAELR
jgi:HEPN domain-containing protein